MKQRVSLITLGVADLGRAKAFYEALGWEAGGGVEGEVAFFQTGDSNNTMTLRYQGTIGQMARQCSVAGGIMRIKLGVQGRIILGPAGTAGALDIPMRYAVVKEGPEPRTLATAGFHIPVVVPSDVPSVAFTHVDESIAFPLPSADDLDDTVVYVGFDPLASAPAAKPQPHGRARPAKR